MNIFFPSGGRRVELVRLFKEELAASGGYVVVGDIDATAPALYVADRAYILPTFRARDVIDALWDVYQKERIDLIVPLLDPELFFYAKNYDRLASMGMNVLMPSPDFVMMSASKRKTHQAFTQAGLPVPKHFDWEDENIQYPVILKPDQGSAGKGIYVARTEEELRSFQQGTLRDSWRDYVIQEKASGAEITSDVLTDQSGMPIHIVQRMRLKTRGGEVERGKTVHFPEIEEYIRTFVKTFKPVGVFNIQCFIDNDRILFTEVNARFGGGYPLSHRAGANFPRAIIAMASGRKYSPKDPYTQNLYMLRFDEAIYLGAEELIS